MSPAPAPVIPFFEALRAVQEAKTLGQLAVISKKQIPALFPACHPKKGQSAEGTPRLSAAQVRRLASLEDMLLSHALERAAALRRRDAAQSGPPVQDLLTQREREMVGQIAGGATDRAAGKALGITTRTASKHIEHALKKLRVRPAEPAA